MNPKPEWVSLGIEGMDQLRHQLTALMDLMEVAIAENGDQQVRFEWAVDLAGLLLPRVSDGEVYASVSSGFDRTSVLEGQVLAQDENTLVLERFLGSGASEFCVILSDYLYASELLERPTILPRSDQLHTFIYDEGVYGIIRLSSLQQDRRKAFESMMNLVNGGVYLIAIAGEDEFTAVAERLWNTPRVTRGELEWIAGSTSRILTTGGSCGQYLMWSASTL